MKPKYNIIRIVFYMTLVFMASACSGFLDHKPDDRLAVPSSLQDLRLILDYNAIINENFPVLGEVLSDGYYLDGEVWASRAEYLRRLYLWQDTDEESNSWYQAYNAVMRVNTVLDVLEGLVIKEHEQAEYNQIRGEALFFRAYYFFYLSQLYAPVYNDENAKEGLGIPLRLDANFNTPSVRPTLQHTYDRIIMDLQTAVGLLPVSSTYKTRPSKPAAYGALAKTYLSMREYELAGLYADSCLQLYPTLMDYNELDVNAAAPIERFNEEVIFHAKSLRESMMNPSRAKVDSNLINQYALHDLRKQVFFNQNVDGSYAFKGDYDGRGSAGGFAFVGIVTDEMYLIRAESHARRGNLVNALEDLNTLLSTRWKWGSYVNFETQNANSLISKILLEREKQLYMRGTRWTDLRRLSQDPDFAVTPQRIINGESYRLLPGSHRYVLLLPRLVIESTGMPQNE